jgi:hypothetical protein
MAGADNYKSAKAIGPTLAAQFKEEVRRGHMLRMKVGEARRRWGNRLTIAALGAIEKADETFRIIYDGSNKVMLNHRIRVRDQVRMLTWHDITKYLGTRRLPGHQSQPHIRCEPGASADPHPGRGLGIPRKPGRGWPRGRDP